MDSAFRYSLRSLAKFYTGKATRIVRTLYGSASSEVRKLNRAWLVDYVGTLVRGDGREMVKEVARARDEALKKLGARGASGRDFTLKVFREQLDYEVQLYRKLYKWNMWYIEKVNAWKERWPRIFGSLAQGDHAREPPEIMARVAMLRVLDNLSPSQLGSVVFPKKLQDALEEQGFADVRQTAEHFEQQSSISVWAGNRTRFGLQVDMETLRKFFHLERLGTPKELREQRLQGAKKNKKR